MKETSFNKILIPIDFTDNTELAIRKAMDLSHSSPTTLYLMHVIRLPKKLFPSKVEAKAQERMARLLAWKESIEQSMNQVKVYCLLENAMNVQECIIARAKKSNADLVIIGKHSHHFIFPWLNTVYPSEISRRTNAAVLTVKPGSLEHKTRIVILPISDFIPEKKLEIVDALCRRFKVKVHLVTVLSNSSYSRFSSYALQETLKLLMNSCRCAVEFKVLHGNNRPKAILNYADEIGADMMLVNPGTETRVAYFPGKSVIDLLAPASRVQVLSVRPYQQRERGLRLGV